MQGLKHVTKFARSMFERFLPPKRSVRLQEQIDELRRDVRRLEAEESRRTLETINLRSRSGHQAHQEDASPIAPFSIITMPAPLHAATRHEPQEQPGQTPPVEYR
jgi:hypothetical protein